MSYGIDRVICREARSFRAERAISPADGEQWWVVIDADLVIHKEATDFLRTLTGASLSPHTLRVYAGRVAVFLTWCEAEGVDWSMIRLPELARFMHSLEMSPIRNGCFRSGSTVNAILRRCASSCGSAPGPV